MLPYLYISWVCINLYKLLLVLLFSSWQDPNILSHVNFMVFQIGAIYLWSYVYNIIRISSSRNSNEVDINDLSITKSSSESSTVPSDISSAEVTEPLLSPNHLALPRTRFEEKPQVAISFTIHLRLLQLHNFKLWFFTALVIKNIG